MVGILESCRNLGRLHRSRRSFEKEKKEHKLDYLFWESTLTCNLRCRHCGSFCSPGQENGKDLSGPEIKKIFKTIAEDFEASDIWVAVTGGEPLTRPDIFEIMEECRAWGFLWGMVTNGTLITREAIKQMEQSGMGTISVSIDGDSKGHAVLRGSEKQYHQAMRGLGLILEYAPFLYPIEVITVVHSRNIDRLEEAYETFQAMGVGYWRLLNIDPIGRMKDPEQKELFLNGAQLGRLLDFVVAKRESGKMEVSFEESGFLGLKYEGRVRDWYFRCPAGISVASILHDGAIGACPSLGRDLVEGDGRRERFSEVWNSRYQRFRDRKSTRFKGPCRQCQWWDYCEGGSLHLWDWERERPLSCSYELLREAGCLSG